MVYINYTQHILIEMGNTYSILSQWHGLHIFYTPYIPTDSHWNGEHISNPVPLKWRTHIQSCPTDMEYTYSILHTSSVLHYSGGRKSVSQVSVTICAGEGKINKYISLQWGLQENTFYTPYIFFTLLQWGLQQCNTLQLTATHCNTLATHTYTPLQWGLQECLQSP